VNLLAFDRGVVNARLLGQRLRLVTGHGLFCADRVDDGTRLLLDHLPPGTPSRVLDLGCGYGALGLPVAACFPMSHVLMVDRDLLAVAYAARNARELGLGNAVAAPSLGYRDVETGPFDWVLCNVPARIGEQAIGYFLGAGAALLAPGGQVRVVVIRDLCRVVEGVAAARGWPVERVAVGRRHAVYGLGPLAGPAVDHGSVYARDDVTVPLDGVPTLLERPHDLSEDPAHLRDGLPLLLDVLPKRPRGRVLVNRGGYGAAAVALARRGGEVTVADRDLLALLTTQRNAARCGVVLAERRGVSLGDVVTEGERWPLLVTEVSSVAGERVAREELETAARVANETLWLGLRRLVEEWLKPHAARKGLALTVVATRGAYVAAWGKTGGR
jgi:16S rRNA G1207 methylase RsmC